MMNTLTIKLKQHTPLIHFQHDQEGATLRASEVKPKLDKYILTQLGNGDYKTGIQRAKDNGWLVGKGDNPALDYKMRIESSGDKEEYLLASYIKRDKIKYLNDNGISAISDTSYSAQEKQNNQIIRSNSPKVEWDKIDKKGVLEKKEITITFLSKKEKILESLYSQIQPFFVSTNFGTRQSKGFGCFQPTEIIFNDSHVPLKDIEVVLKQCFKFVYKKRISINNISDILSTINNDYRLLKSGRTRPYAKSKLMLYAESLDSNIGWDKKYIKAYTNDEFPNEEGDNYKLKCEDRHQHHNYSEKEGYRYFRALLGLAEQFEFLLENPPKGLSKNKMIVKVKNNEIQRYQSPLLFKVFGKNIYLVGNDIAPEMLGKPFDFLVNFQMDSGYKDEPVDESGEPIKTPDVFSLQSFISFAMNNDSNGAKLGYDTIKS